MTLKLLFWICFAGLNALALSPAPYLPPLEIFNWWDKAQHAIGFGILAILASLAYPHVSKYRVAMLLCLQGVAIEVLQYAGGYLNGTASCDSFGRLVSIDISHCLGFCELQVVVLDLFCRAQCIGFEP